MQETEFSSFTVSESALEIIDKYLVTFRGQHDEELFPQVSGTITLVDVKDGQKVRKGNSILKTS